MKPKRQNMALANDRHLLKKARALAAQRGTSISGLLAAELEKLVNDEEEYQQARVRALARLASGFRLGAGKMPSREELHDRQAQRPVVSDYWLVASH